MDLGRPLESRIDPKRKKKTSKPVDDKTSGKTDEKTVDSDAK
jgi:hypothetical protein